MGNNFLQFDSENANILTQEEYLNDTQRINGASSGIARSKLFNKAVRQSTTMAAAIGEIISERGGNATEDITALKAAILDKLLAANGIQLSAEVAGLYGLSGVDANVDNALLKLAEKTNLKYEVFTSSGTFVVPENVTTITISGCGAGGDGGSVTKGNAGQYIISNVYSVTPASTLTIVVGSGNTTISELGIVLLANTITTSKLTNKLGITSGINGSNGGSDGGWAAGQGGIGGAFGFGGGGGGSGSQKINNGGAGYSSNGTSNSGGISTSVNGENGVLINTLYDGLPLAGAGGGGHSNKGNGGNSIGLITVLGGIASVYGAGGGAGGYGAGGGGGGYLEPASAGGKGSPGFILIEW